MSKFTERAKELVGVSRIMNDREKGDTVIGDIVTMIDVEIIHGSKGDYAVYALEEYPENYFNGGLVVTDIAQEILADDELYADLTGEGLKVKFTKTKTRSGNDFTAMEIFD